MILLNFPELCSKDISSKKTNIGTQPEASVTYCASVATYLKAILAREAVAS